jgi:hypothetical protein
MTKTNDAFVAVIWQPRATTGITLPSCSILPDNVTSQASDPRRNTVTTRA